MNLTLTIVFERAEDSFLAYILEIPGVSSSGRTVQEAREMVLDALKEFLATGSDTAPENPKEVIKTEKLSLSLAVTEKVA